MSKTKIYPRVREVIGYAADRAANEGGPVYVVALHGDPQTGGIVTATDDDPNVGTALAKVTVEILDDLPSRHKEFLDWQELTSDEQG